MQSLYRFIARFLYRRNPIPAARIGATARKSLARKSFVAIKGDMRSCDVKLSGDCSHQDAIAEIEDNLRGTRSDAAYSNEVHFDRHGIV